MEGINFRRHSSICLPYTDSDSRVRGIPGYFVLFARSIAGIEAQQCFPPEKIMLMNASKRKLISYDNCHQGLLLFQALECSFGLIPAITTTNYEFNISSGKRQGKVKNTSLHWRAFGPDPSAVGFHRVPGNRQPQTGAAARPRLIGFVKTLKNTGKIIGSDSHSGIPN